MEENDSYVHSHTHTGNGTLSAHGSPDEVKALISYMIHHNEHHADELADLLDVLPENARRKLMTAIGSFEAANVELQEVLDCL